jgi:hypothetical protein
MERYLINLRTPLPNEYLSQYQFLGQEIIPVRLIDFEGNKGLYRIPLASGWGLYQVDNQRAIYTNGRIGYLYKIKIAPRLPLVDWFPTNPQNPIFSEKKLEFVCQT